MPQRAARPRGRRRPAARAVAGAALAAALLAGCASTTSVVDAGETTSAPPLPENLWNVPPRTSPSASPEGAPPYQPEPLPGLTLPSGGDLRGVSAQEVIANDPNVDREYKQSVQRCTSGSGCGLRRPELRDITGDGKPELLVVIDPDPRLQPTDGFSPELETLLYVYWSDEGRVHQIYANALMENTQVDIQGRDLVIRQTREPGWPGGLRTVTTDRYRWNTELRQLEQNSTVTAPAPGNPPNKPTSPSPKSSPKPSPKAASGTS
ncbi:hypothetical protein ACFP1Z_19755 [Streptomyces gamaensis]|uniref:Lipoprotein n=1 Tax=Streptomyces gamaensis TaxID=1763542 RepID=A0ABW0Z0N8_9ACTN